MQDPELFLQAAEMVGTLLAVLRIQPDEQTALSSVEFVYMMLVFMNMAQNFATACGY